MSRFGGFTFDPTTGALRKETGDPAEPQRLAPKPTLLLALLLEKKGTLATRDEIRERLWPDVSVEFEASLHHCVRQVRAALGDTAKEPRFIETVPRRGYRLMCELEEPAIVTPPERHPSADDRLSRRLLISAGVTVGLLGAGAAWFIARSGDTRIRLAILPFDSEPMPRGFALDAARVAEQVLLDATHELSDDGDVLGPRMTGPLLERGASLKEVGTELDVAHLLNLRFVGSDTEPAALIELIRVRDGRHVWVERFEQFDRETATLITAGIIAALRQK